MKIKIIAIAKDEEMSIGSFFRQFEAVTKDWNVLVDSQSTDRTASIAAMIGAKVEFSKFEDFAQQRNEAIHRFAKDADYVIMLDPDERINNNLNVMLQEPFQNPDIEVFMAPLRAVYPNGNYQYWHGKQFLFKNTANFRFSFKVHEKVLSKKQASINLGEIQHHLILHDDGRRDKASGFYQQLLNQEPYFTNSVYRAEIDKEFPVLYYDHNEDDRIIKVDHV